jgi:putative NADH-flavin reductase
VVAEALSRGHEVTAVVRNSSHSNDLPKDVIPQTGDAGNADDVARLSEGQNVVISAIRPAPGRENEFVPTTQALMEGIARTGVRLLIVGGAACLTVPNSGGTLVIDDPRFVPEKWRGIALGSFAQYEAVRAENRVDWAYLCPPAMLGPGERTGRFRLGHDELVLDADGNSTLSIEDLAVVLLDEAERPSHHRTTFTAAY